MILFDIDEFKKVNDMFGHAVGDRVLIQTAQVVASQLRTTDIFGRIGGDEFLVILPETDAGQAYQMAERIRAKVAGQSVETPSQPVTVTISIGIAGMSEDSHPDEVEALIHRADQALYAAKHAGRNRIVTLVCLGKAAS